jgi:NAD(P)-dependent dehydrogenase (short-subunit alcohol dehydrogenase family)
VEPAAIVLVRAAYTASKMAIEGFTGSLAHELGGVQPAGQLVEPGYGPTTRFTSNAGPAW